jgi:dihydrodipicolinate synthase/N-acetylneuraminate lyase
MSTSTSVTETPHLDGIIPPMIVPFHEDGSIDEESFRREVKYLLDKPINGISVGGSTGEGAVLSDDEMVRTVEIVHEEIPESLPFVVGIIKNSTREVIEAMRRLEPYRVDAILITPVFYHGASFEGNRQFFQRVTAVAPAPVIIYNVVPTNIITPDQYREISGIDGILGIKQVDPVMLAEIHAICGDETRIWAACDHMLYSSYVAGARGCISALSTIAPDLCVEQWQAFVSGDQKRAMEIQRLLGPVVRAYLERPFPGRVKELIRLQGRSAGYPQHPTLRPTEAEVRAMKAALSGAGLL